MGKSKKRGYKQKTILVRGKERPLVIDTNEPRAIAYFRLEDEEFAELKEKLAPINFPPSQDIPVGYPGEITELGSTAVLMAEALQILYRDKDLREKALPPFLAQIVGNGDAIMAGVGFDFLVGPHLDHPMLLEAAAFGPEFVSSSIIAEFSGIRTLEERLSTWWHSLVKPCLKGAKSLHYVTSFGDFDFTREKEHEILVPYLQKQGIKATFGPANSKDAIHAEALYIRAGLQFPHVWQTVSQTPLWEKILRRDVIVIPPLGNNFFSSKFWHPLFANPEELEKRGVSKANAQNIAAHMPVTMLLNYNLLQFLRKVVKPQLPLYFKGIWNYGAFGTRRVSEPGKIGRALREIRSYGEMPIVVQEDVKPGFLPFDGEMLLPDRTIEVRVRVFCHKEGKITVMPSSARIYYPGSTFPQDSLYLDQSILP